MRISARNQFKGTIVKVIEGAVNGVVVISLGNEEVKADITRESIKELSLTEGKAAYAIIKATNVMFASGSERIANISARNQLPGTIIKVTEGAVNGHVSLETADGIVISGSITNEAIESLGLKVGDPALAVIKATDVMVGIE
ncbi:TOBE domain-containing protein [Lancefieldella sp. Marseille-Q7238]|uniref:TOBE domain-containing protein n=1 Tax=Lancefieldella sp. Marseille-Q7238 TaxID=3022127 RepID=UPI0024A9C89D|nr:TOBE domain-containing protein [Lancefieldella sp. Marseille-Q7238]